MAQEDLSKINKKYKTAQHTPDHSGVCCAVNVSN